MGDSLSYLDNLLVIAASTRNFNMKVGAGVRA